MAGLLRGFTLFLFFFFRLPLRHEGEESKRFEEAAACCSAGARGADKACGQSYTAEGLCHSATRRCRVKTGLV